MGGSGLDKTLQCVIKEEGGGVSSQHNKTVN